MRNTHHLSREQIAMLVANDLPEGAYVNLGIGMPTLVAEYLPQDKEIILHSENGILGMGQIAKGPDIDPDLINASRQPILLKQGASITEHSTSFAMMRGGHLDYSLLGGFQVASNGDLANWITDAKDAIPAIGGAMDLAVGAKYVWVMMDHVTKEQAPKLLEQCSYPLTGVAVVTRVYTDIAIIDVSAEGFVLKAKLAGVSLEELKQKTGAALRVAADCQDIHVAADGVPSYQKETV